MRKFSEAGQAIPVLAAAPVGDVGLHVDSFGKVGPYQVDEFYLRLALSGGDTATLVLWVQGFDDSWSRAGETGNLGMVGGQALPADGAYVFPVQGLGPFKAACLVKTLTGLASVDGATLYPVFSY